MLSDVLRFIVEFNGYLVERLSEWAFLGWEWLAKIMLCWAGNGWLAKKRLCLAVIGWLAKLRLCWGGNGCLR